MAKAKKKAKRLTPQQIGVAFTQARRTKMPQRDTVILHLSFGLALRPCEIARIQWDKHIFDAQGNIGKYMTITGDIAKNGQYRELVMPDELRAALFDLLHGEWQTRKPLEGKPNFVIYSPRTGNNGLTPNAMVQWFCRFYAQCGFNGCSGYSGRRTRGTEALREGAAHGVTIRDVQQMMGHASVTSTEEYIDADAAVAQRVQPAYLSALNENSDMAALVRGKDAA